MYVVVYKIVTGVTGIMKPRFPKTEKQATVPLCSVSAAGTTHRTSPAPGAGVSDP